MRKDSRPPVNQATFGALAAGVTLVQADFSDHAFERHAHDCFVVGATGHGVQRFRCKGRQYDSLAGDLVLFNPEDDHDGRPGTADGFGYTSWYVPTELMTDSVAPDGGPARSRYFARPHVSDPRLAARFKLLSAGLAPVRGERLRTESSMRAFLGTLLQRHAERPLAAASDPADAGAAALARAREYLRTCYADDLTVSDLAAASGLSRAHLTRAFSARYHISPHVYLNAVRIMEAQARIRRGMPLAMVALECGFADQSHLSRRFKGSVGVTPSAWNRMSRAAVRAAGPLAAMQ
ncbi:AraC family transcriptional regulator [Telluria beijingensis]|uniref:AraC family transcriptional regulator n=1 Tax=Telluria beijingensis TaxID=3068633 RepID=UPI0027957E6F|nr:AraC family transcriptional regulator [Massilia sp. REN29]